LEIKCWILHNCIDRQWIRFCEIFSLIWICSNPHRHRSTGFENEILLRRPVADQFAFDLLVITRKTEATGDVQLVEIAVEHQLLSQHAILLLKSKKRLMKINKSNFQRILLLFLRIICVLHYVILGVVMDDSQEIGVSKWVHSADSGSNWPAFCGFLWNKPEFSKTLPSLFFFVKNPQYFSQFRYVFSYFFALFYLSFSFVYIDYSENCLRSMLRSWLCY